MARIRYIGKKDQKPDNVAGTGAVWIGKGDVQTVPDEAVSTLLRHRDVWELVEEKPAAVAPQGGLADVTGGTSEPAGDAKGEGTGEGDSQPAEPLTAEQLEALDDAAVKALAADRGLEVDGRKKGDKLRAAVLEAQAAAAKA